MIKSFRHQGLEQFYRNGSRQGIVLHHAHELTTILQCLNKASSSDEVQLPNTPLKPLAGELKGHCSLEILPNWHITFTFNDGNATDINYVHLPQPCALHPH